MYFYLSTVNTSKNSDANCKNLHETTPPCMLSKQKKGTSHCRPGRFPGRRDIYAHVCFQALRLLTVNILELSENQRRMFSGACIGFLCSRQEFCREGPYSQSTVACQATAEPSSLEILGRPTCHSWPESHFPHGSCILIFTFQNARRVLGEENPY